MKNITVTLSGGDRENEAPDAWRSAASITDHYVLVDTGASAQKAIEIARQMPEVRDRCTVVKFPGEYGSESCAEGRTFGLVQAGETAARLWPGEECWALMLDTDEVAEIVEGLDVCESLSGLKQSVALTWMTGRHYPKERFFRLPIKGHYVGRVHEHFERDDDSGVALFEGITFSEKPKTKEQDDAIHRRVIAICQEEIAKNPSDSRSRMYLGMSLSHFGDHDAAKLSFLAAFRRAKSDDERGWLAFKTACECHDLEQWADAVSIASEGMRYAPNHPELPWVCAFAEWRSGNIPRALAWADMAIAIGDSSPLARAKPIRAFGQYPPAHREGPWQIRAACFQRVQSDNDLLRQELVRAVRMIDLLTGKPQNEEVKDAG